MQSFIILSPSDLVKIFQFKKLTKNISIKTNTNTSTAKFFEFNKNFKILNKKKNFNLTKKKFSIGLLLFKKLGFLGNLHNIVTNSFSSFYLINYTKLISNKYSIITKFQHTCQNPKWYLIDE
ncbi:hypothetical protein Mapa_018103 [Marchantia paleacea]|nr:hypothetical protein Mapa_018103 [Marchantia paleacea]